MSLTEDEKNRRALADILDRIDAISAAVRGAEFNDKGHQNGISLLLGDVWCTLSDLIEEMGGRNVARDTPEE